MDARRTLEAIADRSLQLVERMHVFQRADVRAKLGELRDRHVLALAGQDCPAAIELGDRLVALAARREVGECERVESPARRLVRFRPVAGGRAPRRALPEV